VAWAEQSRFLRLKDLAVRTIAMTSIVPPKEIEESIDVLIRPAMDNVDIEGRQRRSL
jgi:hypothetical protein